MCETSGSCAIRKQSSILDRYVKANGDANNKSQDVVTIKEPSKTIDKTKQVCFYC